MPFLKYFSVRNCKYHFVVRTLGIILPITFLCFSSPVIAGEPVGGTSGIYIYNVEPQKFSIVWQVDTQSTCTIKLYDNINGPNPLVEGTDYTSVSNTNSRTLAQERGVMQVDVSGLTKNTQYFVQTVSQDGSGTYEFPALEALIPVTTGQELFQDLPKKNGFLELALYDQNGTGNPEQSDGVVAIVDAGGYYPVSSSISGWPEDQGLFIVYIDFGSLRTNSAYIDWVSSPQDHSITIMCFGGLVPGVGLGQRIIETTYPAGNINNDLYECLSLYGIDDLDGCARGYTDQIIMYPNQPPQFDLDTEYTVNRNETLTITSCATDPEGDAVAGFSLSGNPSGMNIATDANCFTITWTPTECGAGIYENIKVTGSDDKGSSSSKAFNVSIESCPPYQPDASIEPQSPLTTQDLTCIAVSKGDPDGDTITFVYEWYEGASPGTILSTAETLSSAQTQKGKEYFCRVIARDKDGDSEPKTIGPVTLQNSPPSAPGSAVITPADPPADQDLTCTIEAATDPDNDPVTYIYQWKCTNCGGKTIDQRTISGTSDTLSSNDTAKGETWSCEVLATDGTAQSSLTQSNTVNIANLPPTEPVGVQITPVSDVKTGDDLTCTIETASTDPDGDDVEYVFTWNCTGSNCGQTPIERAPKVETSDTLASINTAKDQTWSCAVLAQDDFGGQSNLVTSSSVNIENSLPAGLSVQVTPDPAYMNDNLTCTASGVTDADGDAISYEYVWKKDGATVGELTKDFTEDKTTDTIQASNTSQGETWSCEVTAKDTSDAQVGPISDQVLIDNRPPVITTDPSAEAQEWDEGGSHQITVSVSDPDGNEYTLELDTDYVDPGDPNVSEWLEFDSVNYILTANPPVGGSSIDVGYGPGIFKFNFIAEETDGTPIRRVEKLITATVRVPAEVVDDFEYASNKPTLADNGWYKLQGTGSMKLMQEDPNDPNSNHYLKTTVTGTPTNDSQLNYIIYKTITDNTLFNNAYPVIQFSINDTNLYYFDAFVRARNNAGSEDNYFLRYIPQDPNVADWTSKVSGNYVRTNIGNHSVDPNGSVIEVTRNMDEDLYNATGFHYLYLKGIVLRGDINFVDDIKVRSAGPRVLPKDVVNLTAQGNENQVTLQWELPSNQAENIAGYNIYMDTNKIATVTPDKTSYTKTGLANDVTYCFRVTAIDNLLVPNETSGKTACAMTQVTVPLAPTELTAVSKDNSIQLTWKNPSGQHPDLAGYMVYYCDCVSSDCSGCYGELVAADKADPSGLFIHYITKDANQGPLQYDNIYNFTVKAKDTAQPANFSEGKSKSTVHKPPSAKVIDNFDFGYAAGDTLVKKGWYRLQGKGTFLRKEGDGGNNYLEMESSYSGASALDYIIVKWLDDPADFTNPNFAARIRSLGNFRIDVYLKGKDGKNYFLSYKGDKNAEQDSADAITVEKRWFVYTLGWMNKASSTEWYDIERNLNDDLYNAKGIEFDMVLGVLLRGTLDIDNVELGEGILDAENLTARPGDSSVLLSWTLADPNKIDETLIYVNDNLEDTLTPSPDKNDYQYPVPGLTNGTSYSFKVVQVAGEDESKGVSVIATPMIYKSVFTFDEAADLDEWSLLVSEGVVFDVVYDTGVQGNVMYLNPDSPYPDRYYAAKEDMNVSDVTGVTCRIKTSSNFVIWFNLGDTEGHPFMLGFVPGGTAESYSRFGNFAYYFLGSGLTDGNWHPLDLKLDEVMGGIFTGIGTDKINGIYIGGRIYVDDISIY